MTSVPKSQSTPAQCPGVLMPVAMQGPHWVAHSYPFLVLHATPCRRAAAKPLHAQHVLTILYLTSRNSFPYPWLNAQTINHAPPLSLVWSSLSVTVSRCTISSKLYHLQ